jgi:hypothetical protein
MPVNPLQGITASKFPDGRKKKLGKTVRISLKEVKKCNKTGIGGGIWGLESSLSEFAGLNQTWVALITGLI